MKDHLLALFKVFWIDFHVVDASSDGPSAPGSNKLFHLLDSLRQIPHRWAVAETHIRNAFATSHVTSALYRTS
jgi:hypothetical protein